jgi:hypothetical protein
MIWMGAAIGGLQALAGAIQGIKGLQDQKAAQKAMQNYSNQLMGLTEVNQLKGLQVPDISTLKYGQTAQAMSQSTEALKGMGPEGAAQIANLNQSAIQDQAQIAQEQAEKMYERDRAVATEQSRIEKDRLTRQAGVLEDRVTGAGMAAAQGANRAAAGVGAALSGLGMGMEGLMSTENFEQWYKANQSGI